MKRLIYILICFISFFDVYSQDTLRFEKKTSQYISNNSVFVTSVSLGGSMALLSWIDVADRGNWLCLNVQKDDDNIIADVFQYAPIALPWAMKIAGSPTRSGWGQMAVSHVFGIGLMAGSVKLLKDATDEMRPDGSGYKSFPSGHSAWVFLGATMISRELGWRSSWYPFGAYTFATGVAVERVLSKRHFPADVVAGAGIGVLAGELGYLLGDIIFGKDKIENYREVVYCNKNKLNLSLETDILFTLRDINIDNVYIRQGVGLKTAMSLGMPVADNCGVDVKLGLQTTPIFLIDANAIKKYVAPYNRIGVVISPYYRKPIADRFGLLASVGGGYYKNLSLQSLDDAVGVDFGGFVGDVKIGADMSIYEDLKIGLNLGYSISEYEYRLCKNDVLNISENVQKKGVVSGLNVGVSMKLNF